MSRELSQTDLSHSIVVAPYMSFTTTCRPSCSSSPSHQRSDLLGHEVVDPHRDPAAPGVVHERSGLLDGLGPVHLRALVPARAAGDVDGRAGGAELHRDPPTRPSGPSGDQRHLARQPWLHGAEATPRTLTERRR